LLLSLLQLQRLQAPARGLRQDRRFPQHKERFLLYAAPTLCAPPLRPSAACLPIGAESAHARLSLCALCRGAPWAVTGVPSLALRCARSQAPLPAARKILGGNAPPGAAQVSTPTHPHSNPTGDGEGPCLGRRQRVLRLRRGAPSASLRYTNEHFDARTRARMHAPLLTRSHTHTDGHAHTRAVTFRHTRTHVSHTRAHTQPLAFARSQRSHTVWARDA
jgi:hypothetical protein